MATFQAHARQARGFGKGWRPNIQDRTAVQIEIGSEVEKRDRVDSGWKPTGIHAAFAQGQGKRTRQAMRKNVPKNKPGGPRNRPPTEIAIIRKR
jgi:hypothetical protein